METHFVTIQTSVTKNALEIVCNFPLLQRFSVFHREYKVVLISPHFPSFQTHFRLSDPLFLQSGYDRQSSHNCTAFSILMGKEEALSEGAINGLLLATNEITAQTVRNSRAKTGQLRNSWKNVVDETNGEAIIGSPLENAIWEEFGTGEYAVNGDGRQGGWVYVDEKGKGHFTLGKTPNRTLERAFEQKKNIAIQLIQNAIKDAMK